MIKPLVKSMTVSQDHVCEALEVYLRAMSMVDDNYKVTRVTGSGTHFTVIVERE